MPIPAAARLDFHEVPIVRLNDQEARTSAMCAAKLCEVCRDIGFAYVVDHGMPQEALSELRAAAGAFFEQRTPRKLDIKVDQTMRGYLPLDYRSYPGENNDARSHQEGFWIGPEREPARTSVLDAQNRWPAELPDLRTVMLNCLREIELVAKRLRRLFSIGLGVSPEWFETLFESHQSRLKLNHYPPQHSPVDVSHIGVVPHSDSGAFTLLWQDENGGLEVQSANGNWVAAPPVQNSLVLNVGNLLQIWSDGRLSSTPHRVIKRGGVDRYSIPYFVNPGCHAPVRPLSLTANDGATDRYVDYQRGIWERTFPIAFVYSNLRVFKAG